MYKGTKIVNTNSNSELLIVFENVQNKIQGDFNFFL
jgi:hypothetical protein